MALICHEEAMNFAWDEEGLEEFLDGANHTCTPLEGLCYYSISRYSLLMKKINYELLLSSTLFRAGAQVTVQFGCWPSTVHLSRAWLGQVIV